MISRMSAGIAALVIGAACAGPLSARELCSCASAHHRTHAAVRHRAAMIQVVNHYGGEQTAAQPPPVSPYERAYYPGAYPQAPMMYGLDDDDFGYDWPFGYGFGTFVNIPPIFDHHRRGAFRHHVEAHGMGAGRAIAMGHGGRR